MFGSKRFLIVLGLIVAVPIFALLGLKTYYERECLSRLSEKERIEFEKWRTEILNLSPEDLCAAPFQDDTLEAAKIFEELWKEHYRKAVELSGRYHDYKNEDRKAQDFQEFDSLIQELEQVKPLIKAFKDLVNKPDYEIDVFALCQDFPSSQTIYVQVKYLALIPIITGSSFPLDYLPFWVTTHLLELEGDDMILEGDISGAMDNSEIIIRASKSYKYALLMSRLIAMAGISRGTKLWYRAMEQCQDPLLLRQTLERQNALVPPVLVEKDENILITENLGIIRQAMRLGLEPCIEDKTGKEIYGEASRLEADYLEKSVIPSINDPKKKEKMRKVVKGFRFYQKLAGGEIWNNTPILSWISSIVNTINYVIGLPNITEAQTRDAVSHGRYDLLRLQTAFNLYYLERNREPGTLADLAPEFLPEIPQDPFGQGSPFQTKPFLYSLGPNQTDQKGKILYDPTNGTITPGDIYFLSKNPL